MISPRNSTVLYLFVQRSGKIFDGYINADNPGDLIIEVNGSGDHNFIQPRSLRCQFNGIENRYFT